MAGTTGGTVSAWDSGGAVVTGWPQTTTLNGFIFGSPTLADLNGDGKLEVLVGTYAGDVFVWKPDGTLVTGWPKTATGGIQTSLAVGDLDGDGKLEIVAGCVDGKINVWTADGSVKSGWPRTVGGSFSYSSPALADLKGDGKLEIVIGSDDGKVYCLRPDGTALTGWPQTTGDMVYSSPAVGDIDQDGKLEVVVGSNDDKVYAWHADGTTVTGWPQTTGGQVHSSPALADLDGDGKPEVVVGSNDANVYAWHADGTLAAGWPQLTGSAVESSPTVADLDYDGKLEVLVGCDDGKVYAWKCNTGTLDWLAWPTFHHDNQRTGRYLGPPSFTDVLFSYWAYAQIVACAEAGVVKGNTDGSYNPQGPVTRDQIAVYIARALCGGDAGVPAGPSTASFPDVPTGNWAFKYVEYVKSADVVKGQTNGEYQPSLPVTRDQMAVYIARSIVSPTGDAYVPSPAPGTQSFPDISPTNWAYEYIEYCKSQNVVKGYTDGSYGPSDPVTRDQMAVYVARGFKLMR